MARRGFSESDLLSNMYENVNTTVPIGKRLVYNDQSKNTDDINPVSKGRDTTRLDLSIFDVFGSDLQENRTNRDQEQNALDFAPFPENNSEELVDAAFDKVEGNLLLIKANGTILTVDGFMMLADMGTGALGPRGERGRNGIDAKDGEDAPQGKTGCPGVQGKVGKDGEPGDEGKDGVEGSIGDVGDTGEEGIQGRDGPQGRIGNEGARGRKGPACKFPAGTGNGNQGANGTPGLSPTSNVLISSSTPNSNVFVWGIPS